MRTTLEIDDDVLEAAKSLARQSDRTAGAVLSDLARRALTGVPAKSSRAGIGGFVPFESRGGLVTNDQIDRLREQDAYWVRALFDVNVLIALLDTDHVGHAVATSWFAEQLRHGWASCPIIENGTARIMANPGYPNPLPVAAILQRLATAKAAKHHRFWPDDVSLTDAEVFKHTELLGPKQITDRYLLALAVRNKGRFVTFDQGIRPTAVVGATAEHLVQLSG